MKKLALGLLACLPIFGVGSVGQSINPLGPSSTSSGLPDTRTYLMSITWVGDSVNGTVPSTVINISALPVLQGMRLFQIEVQPGTPSPSPNYSITLTDSSGVDLLQGNGASLSATNAFFLGSMLSPALSTSPTFNLSGNSVASARGTVLLYFAPISQVLNNPPAGSSLTGTNVYTGSNTFTGTSTFANIDGIQFVDGVTNTTVQAAIGKLPANIGGVVYVPPGTYVGPTSIPSNTHLMCMGYWFNPASFGGTNDSGVGCHLTYTANLTLTSVTNIEINGFWLDFAGSSGTGMTLTSVQWSRFYMRIDCTGATVCLTLNTTGSGPQANTFENRFERLDLNCNTSQCLKVSGASIASAATDNLFISVVANGQGTVGSGLIEFTQFCDSNRILDLFTNVTNVAGNALTINNSATLNTNVDADALGIQNWTINAATPYTGKSLTLNASSGTFIRVVGGLILSQFNFAFPAASTYTVCGSGQITVLTAADCIMNGRMAINSAGTGPALGSANGDLTVATSATAGTLRLGQDGAASLSRSGTSVTLNAPGGGVVFTNVPFAIANGLSNNIGLQVFNTTTTCTTAASIGATCTTANISLPVAEADTSYRVTCTGKGLTQTPVVIATANASASQFTITIAALTANAASFASYDCVAGHN